VSSEGILRNMLKGKIGIIIAFLAFSVLVTHAGKYGIAGRGADWAHHLSLIEALARDGDRANLQLTGRLGEMALYPPFAHWLAAMLSVSLPLAPPQSLQLLCAGLACCGGLLLSCRYARQLTHQDLSARAFLGVTLGLSVGLAGLIFCGGGVFGHIVFNFFYPQLCATVLALGSIEIIKKCRSWPVILSILLAQILGSLIIGVHLLPALWFYLTTGLLLLARVDGIKPKILTLLGFGLISGGVIGLNPYTAAMLKISANDGVFGYLFGIFPSSALLLLLYLAAAGLGGWLLLAAYKDWLPEPQAFFADQAGFFSIVLLAGGSSLLFGVFQIGSWYSLKKYLLILSCELPAALITLSALLIRRRPHPRRFVLSSRAKAGLILLFTLIQIPWGRWVHDDTDVLAYRRALLSLQPTDRPTERNYPQFKDLLCEENYYLAIGILDFPRDARTMQWFQRGCQGETPIKRPLVPF
jgi:hypothetical protein